MKSTDYALMVDAQKKLRNNLIFATSFNSTQWTKDQKVMLYQYRRQVYRFLARIGEYIEKEKVFRFYLLVSNWNLQYIKHVRLQEEIKQIMLQQRLKDIRIYSI